MNVDNFVREFKEIFICDRNLEYILNYSRELVTNKYLPETTGNINFEDGYYKKILQNSQDEIFSNYIDTALQEFKKNKTGNLQIPLMVLNKVAIDNIVKNIEKDIKIKKQEIKIPNEDQKEIKNDFKKINTDTKLKPYIPPKKQDTEQITEKITEKIIEKISEQITEQSTKQSIEQNTEQEKNKKYNSSNLIKQKLENTKYKHIKKFDLISNYFEIESEDTIFTGGKYDYELNIQNLKTISVKNFNILCDFYNITETNNKFYLIESKNKILINIPTGYYTSEELSIIMTELLNSESVNKQGYTVEKDKIKNRFTIKCKRMFNFSIQFIKNQELENGTSYLSSLNKIIGFKNYNYNNGSFFVGEQTPKVCFEKLYIKLFLDDKEVFMFKSSKTFTYFINIPIDMEKFRGRFCKYYQNDIFELDENENLSKLSFEIYTDESKIVPITDKLTFDTTILLEYFEY